MRNYILEETFYVGEYGFDMSVESGLDLQALIAGEIKGVIKRPNESRAVRDIDPGKIIDAAAGSILFPIEADDFTEPGTYEAQIFIRDADIGRTRPSHVWRFRVDDGLSTQPDNLFA